MSPAEDRVDHSTLLSFGRPLQHEQLADRRKVRSPRLSRCQRRLPVACGHYEVFPIRGRCKATRDIGRSHILSCPLYPQNGHRELGSICPLSANRVLTRRSKSTASLPSPMLINCTQTELDATGRRSRLGTGPTRNGFTPAGQVGELWSDFYVCQTTADVDCDQRGDVGDRETVASDKLVPA